MQRIGGVGIANLGLDDHQRNAVHAEHDVRDDAGLHTARRIDAELVDGVKLITLRMRKVDQLHDRIGLAREFVEVHLRLQEQRLRRFIGFEQGAIRLSQQLVS